VDIFKRQVDFKLAGMERDLGKEIRQAGQRTARREENRFTHQHRVPTQALQSGVSPVPRQPPNSKTRRAGARWSRGPKRGS
jgi:hypothetical protein